MEISLEKVLWAGLALAATTVATLLITRVVNWILQRGSQLIVEVRVNEVLKSARLGDDIRAEFRDAYLKSDDRDKLPFWRYDRYTRFFQAEQYIRLEIKNNTPKKLAGLSMSVGTPSDVLIQVGDGQLIEIPGKVPHPLGDLQPGRTLTLGILVGSLFPTYTVMSIKEAIQFSTDEHVRVRYKFPLPRHIRFRFKNMYYVAVGLLWLALGLVLGVFLSIWKP